MSMKLHPVLVTIFRVVVCRTCTNWNVLLHCFLHTYKTVKATFLNPSKLEYVQYYHTNHTSNHHLNSVYITMDNGMSKKQINSRGKNTLSSSSIFLKTTWVKITCNKNGFKKIILHIDLLPKFYEAITAVTRCPVSCAP
jgi:hypothetical protein